MASDGSDVRHIATGGKYSDITLKPVWSHDGQYIVFADYDAESNGSYYEPIRHFVATVRADGSEFQRIFESESPISRPAWSPVEQRIAFLTTEGGSTVLYTIEADGSNAHPIFTSSKLTEYITSYFLDPGAVSWSPDGSEIRFLAYAPNFGLHSIRADGTDFQTLQNGIDADSVGWSRDGSRIAVYRAPQSEKSVVLYTSAPDGSDRRDLIRYVNGDLVAENSDWRNDEPDCSSGQAVPDPDKNLGLVRDCEIIVSVHDTLAGEGVDLGWRPYRDMVSWEHIVVRGSPPRVEYLLADFTRLHGIIPPELGNLTKLRSLILRDQRLTGPIPPELGNLVNLEALSLDRNELVGDIPQELGNLKNLKSLQLYGNNLTGCIPLALSGQITLVNKPPEFCGQ